MNLLSNALTQRTEVKLKKSKRDKDALTKSEINHLLSLVYLNQQEGNYWGNKPQFDNRTEVIKQKLNNQLKQIL